MDKNCISNVSFIHGNVGMPRHGILKLENNVISLTDAETHQSAFSEPIANIKEITVIEGLNFTIIFNNRARFIISGVDWGDKKFLKSYFLKLVIPFTVATTIIGYSGYKARTSSNALYILPVLIPIAGSLIFRKYIQSTSDYPTGTVDGHAQKDTAQFILDKNVVERWSKIFSAYNMRIVSKNY